MVSKKQTRQSQMKKSQLNIEVEVNMCTPIANQLSDKLIELFIRMSVSQQIWSWLHYRTRQIVYFELRFLDSINS